MASVNEAIITGDTMMMGIGYGANRRIRGGSGLSSDSEFDDFLSASVCEERHGLLSVISMFGRLNIDPREEALKLANLPRPAATHRLAGLIESLPDRNASAADPMSIAAGLLTRLPLRKLSLESAPAAAGAAGTGLKASPWMVILVAAMAIWLGIELFSERPPPASNHPPASETGRS